MRPHWTEQIETLAEQLVQMPRVLIASDYDGTLSTLMDHPKSAKLQPDAQTALIKISALYPRVRLAFISGRALTDLSNKFPAALRGAILAGNHGLEIRGAGLNFTHPAGVALKPALGALAVSLAHICRKIEGVELEDKGLSLTLHYRRVASKNLIELARLTERLHLTKGIRMHHGKQVIEFRPKAEWNKGFALRCIIQHLGLSADCTLYMGDDNTDEDAFIELAKEGTTVHVGDVQILSKAAIHAHNPEDAAAFLTKLADQLEARWLPSTGL
jgi:trehalose 6-phosphate phosphatase